ncbi:MFS transporter [Streptomyces cucumeris]|uniref:MFS transporter n=1 Tax=Streptomyces cucumeris TaxID=2962890 RepID=UPI003D71ABA7
MSASGPTLDSEVTRQLNRKVAVRILPLLCALMFVAYLDRISISYAGPYGMNEELGLTATTFGFAAGIFFVGYILVEVPSNIALRRFGTRRWLSRIVVTWGVIQCLTAFVPNAELLYVARFLLGVAEAGLVPGAVFYLTMYFSSEYRGRAISRFLSSAIVATAFGAPLSLGLVSFGERLALSGLPGWRFLILVTGVPALVLGVVAWFRLDDGPQNARWLTAAERQDITARMADDTARHQLTDTGLRSVFKDHRVWQLATCYFIFIYGAYALTFFLPSMIAGFEGQFGVSYSRVEAALLTAIPFVLGGAGQLWFGRHADRKGRLGAHILVSALIGLVGAGGAVFADHPIVLVACICVMAIGVTGGAPLVAVLSSRLYVGTSSAAAIAIVSALGVTSGFFAPYLTGWLRDLTGSTYAGIGLIGVLLAVCALVGSRLDRAERMSAGAAPKTVFPAGSTPG